MLDDIAALGKLAAASLDDAAAQAAKAGSKAAGIVIDDAAVTPRYVVGLAAERELPIIGKIAVGSLKNKLFILLPAALALSFFAPWVITPLLMSGGVYLCLEGFHKVADLLGLAEHGEAVDPAAVPQSKADLENARVASAIRTDFILSAEILVIALGTISNSPIWLQGLILAAVGLGMTGMVYGVVALIVKADDAGLALAQSGHSWMRPLGRGIVMGMPPFLKGLSLVGMLAMLWVGGGLLVHGLHELGQPSLEKAIHQAAETASHWFPGTEGFVLWLVQAGLSGMVGLMVGFGVEAGYQGILSVRRRFIGRP